MEQQAQFILEIWRMFLRRFWIMAIIGGAGVGVATFIAYIMPPVYESEATILVERQQIPDELARSTVSTGAAERFSLIRQRMMSRDNLLRVINDLALFEERNDLTLTQKIELLRLAATLEPVGLNSNRGRSGARVLAFVIKVRFNDAQKAADIANEFVTNTLDENLRARTERASETLEFFRNEEERLSTALLEIEAQITQFRDQNQSSLPSNIEMARDELRRIAERQFELDQMELQLEEERSSLGIRLAQSALTDGSLLSREQAQLSELRSRLSQKRGIFTESHREIRALKIQIEALEKMIKERNLGLRKAESAVSVEEQIMKQRIAFIETQLNALEDKGTLLESRRVEIEEAIAKEPTISLKLSSLVRRQEELSQQYGIIIKKRSSAETGEKLEVNQQAERFEVIENALAADSPVSPDRPKILMLGSGLAIAMAVALGLFLEIMNPAIRSAAQMERRLELRPIATVPYIKTRRERSRSRLRIVVLFILVAVAMPLALYAIDTYYHPVQLLAEKVLDRTGVTNFVRLLEERL